MAYSELFAAVLISGGCAVPLQSMISDHSLDLMLKDSSAKVLVVSKELAAMTQPFLQEQSQLLPGGLMGFDFGDEETVNFENWLESKSTTAPELYWILKTNLISFTAQEPPAYPKESCTAIARAKLWLLH